MELDFLLWVLGVTEDEPIPHEISNMYFCLHKESYYYLSFGGSEFVEKRIFNFQYYPLDAQFFGVSNNFSLNDLRKLLLFCKDNQSFFNEFYGKNIFYGIFGQKEIYKLD